MNMNGAYIRDFVVVAGVAVGGYVLGQHYGIRPGAVAVSAAALTVLVLQLLGGGLGQIGLSAPQGVGRTLGFTVIGVVLFYAFAGGGSYAARKMGIAPDISSFAYLKGNLPAYLAMLGIVWTSAAFAEEIVFRGFLMNRLRAIDGGGWFAGFTAVIVSSALFGAGHFYQGLGGVIMTGVAGMALGITALMARGNLWPSILTHGIVDTIAMTVLYLGVVPNAGP